MYSLQKLVILIFTNAYMDRRKYIKSIGLGALMIGSGTLKSESLTTVKRRRVVPPRLHNGDAVALIAPGGPVTEKKIELAIANTKSFGLTPVLGKNVRAKHGHTAGTDAERLADLHEAFRNPSVKAIWCIRGGNGCNRLLPQLDYRLIRKNPKSLIGFSDITALSLGMYRKTGLISFHGPIGAWDFTDIDRQHFQRILMEPSKGYTIRGTEETEVWYGGKVSGKLIGGNLCLLAALAGTPYDVDYKNKIVFIEDIGEKPRKIDRMLTQLRQSNNLGKAAAIVLGQFRNCEAKEGDDSLTLLEVLKDRVMDFNVPVVYNFPFGHGKDLATFPVGLDVELDTNKMSIQLRQDATKV